MSWRICQRKCRNIFVFIVISALKLAKLGEILICGKQGLINPTYLTLCLLISHWYNDPGQQQLKDWPSYTKILWFHQQKNCFTREFCDKCLIWIVHLNEFLFSILGIMTENPLKSACGDHIGDKLILDQIMGWYHQAPSHHYLIQCLAG